MSTASARSAGRFNSLQRQERLSHRVSAPRRRAVTSQDAYTYALRVAFLSYLLQPRAKRLQHVAAPKTAVVQRSSTSINDLVKDISLIRDSKSTRFPHGFMTELDKRITGVLVGKERMPEYGDPTVKRTFAVFLNEFKQPQFRKSMEKDRRVEDLLLIFFSSATKELQKGKPPDDDGWKLMVDRHVALFVRLVSSTLKDHDWVRERPELSSRLQTMEKKLLMHDQDLAAQSARNGGQGGTTVEVEVPRSYELKDMPMALAVSRIFSVSYGQVQDDINKNKNVWTEKAALQDLKAYQANLSLNSKVTLSREDFDTDEAYEAWKKSEAPDLSQMVLAIIQSNPELAKSTGGALPQFNESSHRPSDASERGSSYVIDQPVDMNNLNLNDDPRRSEDLTSYTYIPPDPRMFYRAVVKEALTHDLNDSSLLPSEATSEQPAIKLLSKQSTELLNEMALRWRVPQFTRLLMFLDVIREKYEQSEIDLDTLDASFTFVKEPAHDSASKGHKRGASSIVQASLWDRSKWTNTDYALYQHVLGSVHDALLRDLYNLMLGAYDAKPPPIGPVMYILENHIYDDPACPKTEEDLDSATNEIQEGLRKRAQEVYTDMLSKAIPDAADQWEFYNVIELGKTVVKQANKIQKRYRKNPSIMGVNPTAILITEMMPAFASDARDLVSRIMELARQRDEEVPVEDGFTLYAELVSIRQLHSEVLPGQEFGFHIEGLLQEFVWRWISTMDESIISWVENAVSQDAFQVRTAHPGNIPTDDERHSVSVIDVFRSFNQAIERIVQLEWDDDLQYAKFMTALSKAVGIGLARYCELVEQKFSKEMDRLTPEQQAAQNQSTQEKWMKYAKDAWASKEKIEPFQFYPESLVKLNNVENATEQLDKLEREINVDACAEVIQSHQPARQQKKPTTYVFTIKIIEAEDLKACDINGLSDPYVVLGDEYQKRLAKTRVIYSNLNPRWDETVDITTRGPLNIIATIWDWDTLGDHDCVGRTSLKLDPSHFRDFLPREYWLDLDTQGRLLLRVSMEGERDDIQFYFGKAFRTLKRTERDMTRQITDKLSAYIHHCLSKRALRQLLSRGITMSAVSSSVTGFLGRKGIGGGFMGGAEQQQPPTQMEVTNALKPLFAYFDENFAIMKQTLTDASMIMVMTRLWKEVLVRIESLLVPPLSDKPSQQRPLNQMEFDIVFKWLQLLFEFFHAVDDETGEANGVPLDILKSPKYHDLQNLAFFYHEPTDDLIRTSESMARATVQRQNDVANRINNRMSGVGGHQGSGGNSHAFGGAVGLMGQPTRRTKTVMLSRNLGTMKKAKEEKRKEAQAEPSDDMILRILRMRPEAERYLKDRSRQKERLAAAAAAEMIVKQSLAQGGISGRFPPRK